MGLVLCCWEPMVQFRDCSTCSLGRIHQRQFRKFSNHNRQEGLEESRQVAVITILLYVSISRVVLRGANPGVSKPMKQAMKYGWFCSILVNTGLFNLFPDDKKVQVLCLFKIFLTSGSVFSPLGRTQLVSQHLCILVAGSYGAKTTMKTF